MKSKNFKPSINEDTDIEEVPEGWKYITILNVCEVNPPKPPKNFLPADTPVTFVPMPAVDAELGAITTPEIRLYMKVRSGYTSFKDGDVIMAKITPCMENGKAAIIRGMTNGIGFGSTEFHVMRSRGDIQPEYLYYYIRQVSFRKEAENHFTGSVGQKRVPSDFIKNSLIPLPPLAEQQRIVARVEALLAHVNAARERLGQVPVLMKKFRQGVLAAACSGRLTEGWRETNPLENTSELLQKINTERSKISGGRQKRTEADTEWMQKDERDIPESWSMVQINDILHYQRSAGYGVLQPGTDIPDGIPMVRVCDIIDGKVLSNQLKRISPDIESQYKRTRLEGGEVLVTLVGTIGRTGVVPFEIRGANVARAVAVLPLCPHINPEYVSYSLSDPQKNVELVDLAREVARKTLNLGLLKAVEIPLPPLAEQHEIVRRVGMLFERVDAVEREVAEATKRAEAITQAVLLKAFKGELVSHEIKTDNN